MNPNGFDLTPNFGNQVAAEADRLFPGWQTLSDLIAASGLGTVEMAMLPGKLSVKFGLKKEMLEPMLEFLATYAVVWAVVGARARERRTLPRPSGKPN